MGLKLSPHARCDDVYSSHPRIGSHLLGGDHVFEHLTRWQTRDAFGLPRYPQRKIVLWGLPTTINGLRRVAKRGVGAQMHGAVSPRARAPQDN